MGGLLRTRHPVPVYVNASCLLFKSVRCRGLYFREMNQCENVLIIIITKGRTCRGEDQAAQCRDEAGGRGGGGVNIDY